MTFLNSQKEILELTQFLNQTDALRDKQKFPPNAKKSAATVIVEQTTASTYSVNNLRSCVPKSWNKFQYIKQKEGIFKPTIVSGRQSTNGIPLTTTLLKNLLFKYLE